VDPLPPPPSQLAKLFSMKIRSSNVPNDAKVVQAFMEKRISERIAAEKGVQLNQSNIKRFAYAAVFIAGCAAIAAQLAKRR
jgi:hypothetical protein